MLATSDSSEGEHSWLNEEFQDNLMHVRLIRKDGTTVPVKILLQFAYQAGYAQAKADCLKVAPEERGSMQQVPCPESRPGCLVLHRAFVESESDKGFNAAIDLYQQHIREMK